MAILHEAVQQKAQDEDFNALAAKLSDYYQMETTYVRSEKDIVIILHVPGTKETDLLTIYRYLTFPIPIPILPKASYFNIVKKKIHALRNILTDLNPSELLGIAHGSIYSVLHYVAGTWLNEVLQEKYLSRLKVLSNSMLQIVFGKRRQECSTLELHSLANMLTPSQMALSHPRSFFCKRFWIVKAPRDLYTLAMSLVAYKERT
jgi:hypothetical protein